MHEFLFHKQTIRDRGWFNVKFERDERGLYQFGMEFYFTGPGLGKINEMGKIQKCKTCWVFIDFSKETIIFYLFFC